jgi:hypothetical protein
VHFACGSAYPVRIGPPAGRGDGVSHRGDFTAASASAAVWTTKRRARSLRRLDVVTGFLVTLLASPPLDFQLHDSYFVVAHFHYVLFGTIVFSVFGASTSGPPR